MLVIQKFTLIASKAKIKVFFLWNGAISNETYGYISQNFTFFHLLEHYEMKGQTVYPELSINFESAKCCQLVRHGYW